MRLRAKLKLPKEHGAWAMLFVPMAAGVLIAKSFSPQLLLFMLSATLLFISRESLLVWLRARSRGKKAPDARQLLIIYLSAGLIPAAPLILHYRLVALIPMALAALTLAAFNVRGTVRFNDRTAWGDSVAILGLTITAPAAFYVASGRWDNLALLLWALSAMYFASSIYYVKLRVASVHAGQAADRRGCARYHGFLLGSLVLMAYTGNLRWLTIAAFCPVLIRSFAQLIRPASRVNLRRAGILEIVYSLVFLFFITLTYRA